MSELLQDTIETPGFKPDEMLACPKCARATPPTRLKCMYCGADLPITDAHSQQLRPGLRKLESWEKGFNVIILPAGGEITDVNTTKAASVLKLEKPDLRSILDKGVPLPAARAESEKEAEAIAEQLKTFGIGSRVISDEILQTDKPTQRLRGINFEENGFTLRLFNSDELVNFESTDLRLIVTGYIFQKKIETEEALKAKKGNKTQDVFEMSSDEPLIDIFTKDHPLGFRIETKGFDFSCLGAEMGLLAKDNIRKLAERLKVIAPDAFFSDNYTKNRAEIGMVWDVEERNDAGGIQKVGMGDMKRKTTILVNNVDQFTRYGRMQFQLL